MKVAILAILLAVNPAYAQTFTIAGKTFQPAYTNSSSTESLAEYLPPGQKLDGWTNLFAVRWLPQINSPKEYINKLASEYSKNYPKMPFASGEQKAKNRAFIDFIAYPKKGRSKYLEWNFFRAQENPSGGITVFQYAERNYFKKHPDGVSEHINDVRKQLLPFLMTNEFAINGIR